MNEDKDIAVQITLTDNGPVLIKGPFVVIDSAGNSLEIQGDGSDKFVSLCRCGRSTTMPFCDGSHAKG